MISKKIIIIFSLIIASPEVFSWGKTGHRIIGELAQKNLTSIAQKNVKEILGDSDLSKVSTFPDEIRSDIQYAYTAPWHYVSIPNGKNYFDQKRNKDGDVIEALFRFEETLRNPKASKEDKVFALKFMVHNMGDLHQPLHVGLAEDRGGNSVRIKWFKKETNLHALWDEDIVDFEQLSYTEYSNYLNHFTSDEKKNFTKGTFLDWANESQALRSAVYDIGETGNIGYEYHYKIKPTMELRLRQAGLRLSNVLNRIFKKEKITKEYETLKVKIKENL